MRGCLGESLHASGILDCSKCPSALPKNHVTRMLAKHVIAFVDQGFKGVPSGMKTVTCRGKGHGRAYEVLDVVDFGSSGRFSMVSPVVTATLVLNRTDKKDSRKRWNQDKITEQTSCSSATSSTESLSRTLSVFQPSVAAMSFAHKHQHKSSRIQSRITVHEGEGN